MNSQKKEAEACAKETMPSSLNKPGEKMDTTPDAIRTGPTVSGDSLKKTRISHSEHGEATEKVGTIAAKEDAQPAVKETGQQAGTLKPVSPRDSKGRFQRGFSGNPKGRPKTSDEMKLFIKKTADDSYVRLEKMLHDPLIKRDHAMEICKFFIDRAYGKSTQPIVSEDSSMNINVRIETEEEKKAEEQKDNGT